MTIKEIEVEKKAKELIESFYLCMPFKDVKLTSCGEKPGLIVKMEKLSAKQCAIITVDEILFNLKSIPTLTVCEIEGLKCYGIIDFYEDVKLELVRREDHYA